jgi:hypothetical protein
MNSSSHINPTEYDQAWKNSNYMQSKTIHDLTMSKIKVHHHDLTTQYPKCHYTMFKHENGS